MRIWIAIVSLLLLGAVPGAGPCMAESDIKLYLKHNQPYRLPPQQVADEALAIGADAVQVCLCQISTSDLEIDQIADWVEEFYALETELLLVMRYRWDKATFTRRTPVNPDLVLVNDRAKWAHMDPDIPDRPNEERVLSMLGSEEAADAWWAGLYYPEGPEPWQPKHGSIREEMQDPVVVTYKHYGFMLDPRAARRPAMERLLDILEGTGLDRVSFVHKSQHWMCYRTECGEDYYPESHAWDLKYGGSNLPVSRMASLAYAPSWEWFIAKMEREYPEFTMYWSTSRPGLLPWLPLAQDCKNSCP